MVGHSPREASILGLERTKNAPQHALLRTKQHGHGGQVHSGAKTVRLHHLHEVSEQPKSRDVRAGLGAVVPEALGPLCVLKPH